MFFVEISLTFLCKFKNFIIKLNTSKRLINHLLFCFQFSGTPNDKCFIESLNLLVFLKFYYFLLMMFKNALL